MATQQQDLFSQLAFPFNDKIARIQELLTLRATDQESPEAQEELNHLNQEITNLETELSRYRTEIKLVIICIHK